MNFHEKLAKALSEPGWSQARIIRATGMSQSALSEIVNGRRRPYLDQALLIAKTLGLSLDYLADDEMEKPAPAFTADERAVVGMFRMSGLSVEEATEILLGRQPPPSPKANHKRLRG
jgi:transcriptional regulator with XRE-family HTH domain